MARRITCRTPSTGKPIIVKQEDVSANTFVTLAEAPDFSVPDTSNKFPDRDPNDDTRAIRPGEIFFLTPLAAKNKGAQEYWIEIQMVTEDGFTIEFGRVPVPPEDTVLIPIQGRSLLRRNATGLGGDKLQVIAEADNVFDVWASAEEKLSSEHLGVE